MSRRYGAPSYYAAIWNIDEIVVVTKVARAYMI